MRSVCSSSRFLRGGEQARCHVDDASGAPSGEYGGDHGRARLVGRGSANVRFRTMADIRMFGDA